MELCFIVNNPYLFQAEANYKEAKSFFSAPPWEKSTFLLPAEYLSWLVLVYCVIYVCLKSCRPEKWMYTKYRLAKKGNDWGSVTHDLRYLNY